MIALDTSVLARLILRDNLEEQRVALELIVQNECFVSWSVLIELCWVLERSARLPKEQVIAGLTLIAQYDTVTVPDHYALDWALERFAAGADFPDMVHLITGADLSDSFATFDRRMPREAGAGAPLAIAVLKA